MYPRRSFVVCCKLNFMEHIIDAKGKPLGRIASRVALILQGKHTAAYNPRLPGTDTVVIRHASDVVVSGRKVSQKVYYRHAGALGHLKERKYRDVFAKDPRWVLRHAIERMLPKNRLQAQRMKKLVIEK